MRGLLPLVPLYAAGVAVKNTAWDRGWLRPKRLQLPVVSIGNLSAGGSGKTPLVIRLAQLLRERGIAVDVLSRGYGRRSSAVEGVRPGGSADEFGDEPLLIAQSAEVPVFVGADRYAAGALAERQGNAALHLLDDGFQHRQLARDVDIVVLHRSEFVARLLPAGRLREGFSSLRRAQIIAMREEDREMEPELRRRGFRQPVWWMERQLEVVGRGRAVAFCGIARPEEFFSALTPAGVSLAAIRAWRDHHRFTEGDLLELTHLLRETGAEGFVTTEKDFVRLPAELRKTLESAAPLECAQLRVRLDDEPRSIDQLLALLPGNRDERGAGAAPDA